MIRPSTRHFRRNAGRVVAAVAVVAVVVATVPPPAAADCTGEAQFDGDRFVDQRGDVVEIRLQHCGTGDRTVEIAGNGYSASVTLHDETGDDTVTLLVNTFAPVESAFAVADPRDEFVVQQVEGADGPLAAGEYDLRAAEVTYGGTDVEDTATMVVENRSLTDLEVLTAPARAFDDLTTPAALRAARANGTVSDRPLLTDDVAVVVLSATGLGGPLARASGPNASARFLAMADGAPLSLRAIESERTVDAESPQLEVPLVPGGAVRAVPDPRNDTYYVLVDLGAAEPVTTDGEATGADLEAGDVLVANASVADDSPLSAGGGEQVRAETELAVRGAAIDRPSVRPVYLFPGENLTVDGTTNVRPGRTLTLALEEPGSVGSFRRHVTATVGPDGGFSATFDLRRRTDGTELGLSVAFDGDALLAEPVRVLVDDPDASVTIDDQPLEAGTVTVSRVSLSRPGFVAVHDGGPRGTYLGASDLLAAGTHENVTVAVDVSALPAGGSERVAAVVYRDADRNGTFDGPDGADPAIERDRRAVNDRATLDVPADATPTPTAGTPAVTPTPTPTAGTLTDTAAVGTEGTPPGTTPPDGGDGDGEGLPVPGFGAGVAVVALAGLLALARRS